VTSADLDRTIDVTAEVTILCEDQADYVVEKVVVNEHLAVPLPVVISNLVSRRSLLDSLVSMSEDLSFRQVDGLPRALRDADVRQQRIEQDYIDSLQPTTARASLC
jgi:hypothetical protein